MHRTVGYARVSSDGQDLTLQCDALTKAGCSFILKEKQSGTRREGREHLAAALSALMPGDTLVVTRLDRLGRSLSDLSNIADELKAKGAHLRVIEQPVDTSTSAGMAFFGMLAVFAQFETSIRRDRQMEGIAKAKAKGKYKGRKATIDAARIKELSELGYTPTQISRKLEISRDSVYRVTSTKSAQPSFM